MGFDGCMRIPWLVLTVLTVLACGSDSDGTRGDDSVGPTGGATAVTGVSSGPPTSAGTPTTSGASGDTSGGGMTTISGITDVGTTHFVGTGETGTGGGVKLDLPVPEAMPIPVHDIFGLKSITFYEATGGITEYTFGVDSVQLNERLPDPLGVSNCDIQGTTSEYYDVYYSEKDGTFNPDGSYLTIAGAFGTKLPAGGGLNLAEISLNSAIIA